MRSGMAMGLWVGGQRVGGMALDPVIMPDPRIAFWAVRSNLWLFLSTQTHAISRGGMNLSTSIGAGVALPWERGSASPSPQ